MSTQWKLMLEVQSSSKANTDSLAAALITTVKSILVMTLFQLS